MQMNVKWCVWIVAMSLGMTLTGGMGRVMATASPQDQHDQDYSKNKKLPAAVCATAAMTIRINAITPKSGNSKKTKTIKLTRLAIRKVTGTTRQTIDKTGEG